jgi:hypothetical protein
VSLSKAKTKEARQKQKQIPAFAGMTNKKTKAVAARAAMSHSSQKRDEWGTRRNSAR